MLATDFLTKQDAEYIIGIRREIHRHPGLGFDVEHTLGIIQRELDAMGIPHTREYGKGSLVGFVGKEGGFTIAIRADIDALPLQEKTGLPYASGNPRHSARACVRPAVRCGKAG